jgi:tRNA threonylcarbamoyladenosine biosynthesis protein TsaB
MRLLVIDTANEFCSAALRQPGASDIIVSQEIGRGHAERLAPMVEALLARANLPPSEIDRIGVTTGPGSFAGVRVGIAFARGLALAVDADCIGVSSLAALAHGAASKGHDPVCVIHDARRGEFVVQVFRSGQADAPPQRLSMEAATQAIAQHGDAMTYTGSGANLVAAVAGDADLTRMAGRLDMSAVLDLAGNSEVSCQPPSPFYARPPDAKLPGGAAP